jgi:hypothetical protein
VLRIGTRRAQITRKHRHSKKFLDVTRRCLEPPDEGGRLFAIQRPLVVRDEPLARLRSDGGLDLFVFNTTLSRATRCAASSSPSNAPVLSHECI